MIGESTKGFGIGLRCGFEVLEITYIFISGRPKLRGLRIEYGSEHS